MWSLFGYSVILSQAYYSSKHLANKTALQSAVNGFTITCKPEQIKGRVQLEKCIEAYGVLANRGIPEDPVLSVDERDRMYKARIFGNNVGVNIHNVRNGNSEKVNIHKFTLMLIFSYPGICRIHVSIKEPRQILLHHGK